MRLFVAALFLAALPAFAADSILGTWRLNLEQSEFSEGETRYEKHLCTWEIVEKRIRYEEERVLAGGKPLGHSEFTVAPNGAATKPAGETTFSRAGQSLSVQLFGDDMLWVNAIAKDGFVVARWTVVLTDGGNQLVVTQVKGGGNSKRVFDRVE